MAEQIAAMAVPPALFQQERQQRIVEQTLAGGRVEVTELASMFNVTAETIRRDLSDLQKRRLLRRVHGGAIPWETGTFEPSLAKREDHHAAEKRRLAQAAIEELPEQGDIIIDGGSTLTRFAEVIPRATELRVVTNSLPVVNALTGHESIEIVLLGGALRKNTMTMVDEQSARTLEEIRVNTLFISTDGASPARGLSTPYRYEAALKSGMIRAASRVVALVDHSKFASDQLIRFAEWSDVDVLITNDEVSEDVIEAIRAKGTIVKLA